MAKAKKVVKLKPCPFCGSKPSIPGNTHSIHWNSWNSWFVRCYKCYFVLEAASEVDCINAWNKRYKGKIEWYDYKIKQEEIA